MTWLMRPRRYPHGARLALTIALVTGLGMADLACRQGAGPEPTPEQLKQLSAGISAMPPEVTAVVRIDVPAVVRSGLARRLTAAWLGQSPRWQRALAGVSERCGPDAGWLGELVVGVGLRQDNGIYPTVIAAQSGLAREAFVSCAEAVSGTKANSMALGPEAVLRLGTSTSPIFMVEAASPTRGTQWIIANQDQLLLGALGAARGGASVLSNTTLAPLVVTAGQGNLPVWAAGLVPGKVAERVAALTKGRVAAGPSAMVLRLGLRDGVSLYVAANVASMADSNELKILVNSELGLLAMAAQAYRLGPYVSSVSAEAIGSTLVLRAAYSAQEIEQLLAAIDNPWPNQQDAPPAQGLPTGTP